jgi:hypothetical protein
LKKFILVSNLQRTYALCGLVILMSNFVTPHAVAENTPPHPLDTYYFFTSATTDTPIFWDSPIVPVEYDETGDHGHILARARAFAAFYAMASEEAVLGPIAGGMFENVDNIAPTFGMVVADFQLENGKLTFPLKDKLETEWGDAPVAVALAQTTVGSYCIFLGDGDIIYEPRQAYNISSFVILAHSSLSDGDMMTCFRNNIAFMFGLIPPLFDVMRKMESKHLMIFDFGMYPQLLLNTAICRKDKPNDILDCTIQALNSGHKYIVNDILGG